jgi:hypothetical protein
MSVSIGGVTAKLNDVDPRAWLADGLDRLLIVTKDQSQDLHYLPVTASALQWVHLQPPKDLWQFSKKRSVAKGTWLALKYCEVVAPFIDRSPRQVMDRSMIR